jgi:hypothetical protein
MTPHLIAFFVLFMISSTLFFEVFLAFRSTYTIFVGSNDDKTLTTGYAQH